MYWKSNQSPSDKEHVVKFYLKIRLCFGVHRPCHQVKRQSVFLSFSTEPDSGFHLVRLLKILNLNAIFLSFLYLITLQTVLAPHCLPICLSEFYKIKKHRWARMEVCRCVLVTGQDRPQGRKVNNIKSRKLRFDLLVD